MSDNTATLSTGNSYLSNGQQTVLAVLKAMCEQPLEPWSVAGIAQTTGINRDRVFRACHNLRHAGLIETAPGGNWRIAPLTTQLSERVRLQLADLHSRYLNTGTVS